MSMAYIRKTYGVPAKRGGRVVYKGGKTKKKGTIVGSCGAYLSILLDGGKLSRAYHPTWEIEYLPEVKP